MGIMIIRIDFKNLEHDTLPDPEGRALDERSRQFAELEAAIQVLPYENIPPKR